MESDPNPFPKFEILKLPEIDLLKIAKGIGRGLVSCVSLHQLSPRSEHFVGAQVDEMLLSEDVSGAVDRSLEYWQPMLDYQDEHGI